MIDRPGPDRLPSPVLHMCRLCGGRVDPVLKKDWSGPMVIFACGMRCGIRLYLLHGFCPEECTRGCRRIDGEDCPGGLT